ncbi:MAG: alpha/beta hydrolase [Bacteroidota bacterium]
MTYTISGAGKPFIFQHGLGSSKEQGQGLLGGIAGYELISMDCPGHGKAPLPDGMRPSFQYYGEQVVQMMQQLGIRDAHFGGISMGSGISLWMAIHHPERVRSLTLVRPAWLNEGSPANLQMLVDVAQYQDNGSGQAEYEKRADYQMYRSTLPNAAKSLMGLFAKSQQSVMPLVLKSMVADFPFQSYVQLNKIQVPTLVIGNEDDPLHPLEMAEIIHKNIPNSSLKCVVSRYIDNEKHRDQVFDLVTNFLQNPNKHK